MDNGLKLFTKALRFVEDRDLPSALALMLPYAESHPYASCIDELKSIEENYQLMAHYMEKGVMDPMRDAMYSDMLSRLNKVVRNMRSDYRRQNIDFYRDANSKVSGNLPYSVKSVRQTLEGFVSDVAMLQLEPEETRKQSEKKIYDNHYAFMSSLFCSIVVADLWTKEKADNVLELLLLPTIDSSDVQMIVSALMLAAMNSFDINKFSVLVGLYRNSKDEQVRQKALVGWVLSMTDSVAQVEQKTYIDDMCSDASVVRDIVDMQRQVVFCMSSEKDTAVIEKDIMPTLYKNSNLAVSRLGISEKEEDVMRDILDPGAEDRAMEETEEKFRQMMDMQKSGADIYFGGFSQMKRFPFFYTLSNWFTPFNVNHPEITKRNQDNNSHFLENLLQTGPFCDSDKYSFAIAVAAVIDKLPASVREMMGNPDIFGVKTEESLSPAYIRRQTLQDLYRFFRLYRWHEQIYNPFTTENCLFIKCSLFRGTLVEKEIIPFVQFLMKRSDEDLLKVIVPVLTNYHTDEANMILGIFNMEYSKNYLKAEEYFQAVLKKSENNKKAKLGYARALFRDEKFSDASRVYANIYEENPENRSIAFEYAIILAQLGLFSDAAEIIYRLDFQYPETANIKRVLAWGLMGQKKLEQADREYQWLLSQKETSTSDYLNAGYCKWFMGNIGEAAKFFGMYCEKTASAPKLDFSSVSATLGKEFLNDRLMLDNFNVSATDRILLKTITYNKISNK